VTRRKRAWFRSTEGGWWTKVDRRLARWLGCLQSDLLDHGWVDFIHEDDREKTRRATDMLQAGDIPPPYTQRWITMSGWEVQFTIHLLTTQNIAEKEIVGRIEYVETTKPQPAAALSGSTREAS
jgi:PAS domain S-box-containing protein